MSDHGPITGELRAAFDSTGGVVDLGGHVVREYLGIERERLDALCDAIDAVHANLERENEALRERLAKPSGGARSIGSATVTITPTLDWTGVARELRELAALCERTKEVDA